MQKICTDACNGPFARVAVFRDSAGSLTRLRYDGDMETCSHPPRIYFDPTGEATLTVPERPVVAGSPEAEALAADQAAQTEGASEAEILLCDDPQLCEPGRVQPHNRSSFACRSDSDCVDCACEAVDRPEWERRGGDRNCNVAGEECAATNPACCDGVCVMAN